MAALTKGRQIFLYLAPFPALVSFKIWASLGRDPHTLLIGVSAILAYCVFILVLASCWDKPTYFDWAVGGYFLAVFLCLELWPEATGSILSQFAVTGVYTCLFVAAFFPPLIGMDPFTYHYAKKSAPEVVWNSLPFVMINRLMTYVWAGIFFICALISLFPSIITRALIPVTIITATSLIFNRRFPEYYMRRFVYSNPGNKPGPSTIVENRNDAHRVITLPRTSSVSMGTNSCSDQTTSYSQQEELCLNGLPKTERKTSMKVMAINSSPRGEKTSRTFLMLDSLIKGMREAGAEVRMVHLRDKQVRHCIGCFTCWTKTPGTCVHKDDMTNELLPEWLASDLCVYATPLYHFTVNADMKNFIERTLPNLEPFFVERGGKTTHPMRKMPPGAVMLSVAGFPEHSVFKQLSSYAHFLFGKGLVAEIYRPGAEMMALPKLSRQLDAVLEATITAGKELVNSMKISDETLQRITMPLMDSHSMAKMANIFWKSCISEGVNPKEFQQKRLVPSPDSIESFTTIMTWAFDPKSAGETRATIQFTFSGEAPGACWFKISNGEIRTGEGFSDNPDLTIESPFDLWVEIMTGKADGQKMLMQGKYMAKGDFSLLIRMKELFGAGGS